MNVALTFDDGYIRHYYIALILQKLGIKATFFMITHLTKHPDNGRPLLTSQPNKIKEMFKMGHEIGSHSCTHPNLKHVSSSRLKEELEASKSFLENLLGAEIYGFAYPYGAYDSKVVEEVKKYYSYGRGGYSGEDIWNMSVNDKYRIHAAGVKMLLKFPLKSLCSISIKLVIMLHDESPIMILMLIRGLQILCPKIRFVTMQEMAKLID